jgi:2-succinyl-5-enolpyruvyl-6-hydroxy-3-cyclohexene-1-carboxylate synthase
MSIIKIIPTFTPMISSNKKGVQILVEQCIAHGMKHVVFSPGSRNAPFIIAFDEHPDVKCSVIHDERSAAFFAMGMAQQLNEPVGIICTSGSALLNYYPAVAEAYYQSIPLVVITADRPSEWVDQGDGQTIVQHEVFKNHIRYSCTLGEKASSSDEEWFLEREISTAFNHGNGNWKGPIHINMSFNEPLYGTEEIEQKKGKVIQSMSSFFQLNSSQEIELKNIWENSPKKMIICGQLPIDKPLLDQLKQLSDDTSVVVIVENTSNQVHQSFVHCIDRTLNAISADELEDFSPDLLITLGGAVVSKRIKSYLRKYNAKNHWKVGFEFPYMDTFQILSHTFECSACSFTTLLNSFGSERNVSSFGSKWKQKDFMVQDKLPAFFESAPYSDLKVFETILDYIPEMSHLHMANSSVVRYCQLFDPVPSINYWSNRGTSGIDGSSSTAFGAASIDTTSWNTLITGDVSFFYDSNAFWNNHLGPNIRIFMINNGGGGIFKIIPGPNSTNQLKDYFVAEHSFSAEYICKAFLVDYFKANSIEGIENQMEAFFEYEENGRPKLMEIFTPSDINPTVLEDFFNKMA